MSHKTQEEVLAFIRDLQTTEWRPPHRDIGLGSYVYHKLPPPSNSHLAKFNTYRFDGEKSTARERVLAEEDEEDEDELADAVGVKTGIRLDENEEDGDQSLSVEQLNLCEWEKSKLGTGKWLTKFSCPSELNRHLIGHKGMIKEQFEKKFNGVTMTLDERGYTPPSGAIKLAQRLGQIELRHGSSRTSLLEARADLEEKISSLYPKLPYTHFVSIPFLIRDNTEVIERFSKFRKEVLRICDPIKHKVDATIFQQPGQLHITLCMLRLYRPHELETAINTLNALADNPRTQLLFSSDTPQDAENLELPPRGLHIHLKGLSVMQESATETSVLYTHEYSGRPLTPQNQISAPGGWLSIRRSAESYLTGLIEELSDGFCAAGLLDEEEMDRQRMLDSTGSNLDVKLHVTLMNDKYRDASSPLVRGMPAAQSRICFDATPILKELSSFDFGVGVATGLHLSRRGKPATDTTYYEAECVVPIRPLVGL